MKTKKEGKKSFAYKFLRINFIISIAIFLFLLILPVIARLLKFILTPFYLSLVNLLIILFAASIVCTFVSSIIYLIKYRKNAFSIIALVISTLFILLFSWLTFYSPI
jgi:hypothetical protein